MNQPNMKKYNQAIVRLKSWRGDYLIRPNISQGVAATNDGDMDWVIECLDNGKIKFKSAKGDYLHRPDSRQGVTTWAVGIGNEWNVEKLEDGTLKLRSWKGDFLHRPAGADTVVTTWPVGIGNHWTLEVVNAKTEVVINDIFYDGLVARTEADEYVEITNKGIRPADISGWKITADGNRKEYVFAAETTLQVGEVIRVFTNEEHPEFGGFSYKSGRSLWNNKGDTGRLHNAAGEEQSNFPYGLKKERGIKDVLREQGVLGCKVVARTRKRQGKLNNKIDFLTALEMAVKNLIEAPADGDRYTAATAITECWDNVPADASASMIQDIIRDHIKGQKMLLLHENSFWMGDAGQSIEDTWIFFLEGGGMGDTHYIYVDRQGVKATYQEIS